MSNDFDLFATPEEDNLKEELAKGSYRWTNKYTSILGGLLVIVATASAGAWYGHHTATSSTGTNISNLRSAFGGFGGGGGNSAAASATAGGISAPTGATGGGFGGGGGFGRGTSGSITKITGTTLEIIKADGSKVVVNATDQTPVLQSTKSTLASLKVGDTVTVTGQTGADGSVTPIAITSGAVAPRPNFGGQGGTAPIIPGASPATTGGVATPNAGPVRKSGTTTSKAKPKSTSGVASAKPSAPVRSPGVVPGAGGGGGGRFSDPAFTACLAKAGVTFTAGARPDFQDPKVAAAMASCRSLLPGGGQPGAGGGGGFGSGRPAGAPTPAASPS